MNNWSRCGEQFKKYKLENRETCTTNEPGEPERPKYVEEFFFLGGRLILKRILKKR
jgi:hypothetical protein